MSLPFLLGKKRECDLKLNYKKCSNKCHYVIVIVITVFLVSIKWLYKVPFEIELKLKRFIEITWNVKSFGFYFSNIY